MKKSFFINYVCEVNYPNTSAYGIHVLKMCDALASKKYKINLIVPSLNVNTKTLSKNFKLKNKVIFFSIFNKPITFNFITRILFVIKVLKNKKINNYDNLFFISRSPLFGIISSLFNQRVILELHHELSSITKFLYYFLKNMGLLNNLNYIFIHKNLIKIFNPPKSSWLCLDDAVDVNDFKLKKITKKINKTCIYIGSFHKGKGLKLIFEIAKKLKNINFHLYGDKTFLSQSSQPKNIKIFNHVSYKEIPKILSKYEIALMPYGNWVSGRLKNINLIKSMSPLKMFDYLASSNIIIASNLPVYKHILKNNFNSILIDNSKVNLWIKWIDQIFNSKKKYNYIKKNAFMTANKYTWIKRSKKIIKFANKKFKLNYPIKS